MLNTLKKYALAIVAGAIALAYFLGIKRGKNKEKAHQTDTLLANFGMIPLFGSVLPFVSYGSTPTLVYCLLFGAVLALTRQQAVEKKTITEK